MEQTAIRSEMLLGKSCGGGGLREHGGGLREHERRTRCLRQQPKVCATIPQTSDCERADYIAGEMQAAIQASVLETDGRGTARREITREMALGSHCKQPGDGPGDGPRIAL